MNSELETQIDLAIREGVENGIKRGKRIIARREAIAWWKNVAIKGVLAFIAIELAKALAAFLGA